MKKNKKFKKVIVSFLSTIPLIAYTLTGVMPAGGSDIYKVSTEDKRFSYSSNTDGSINIKASENVSFSGKVDLPSSLDGKAVVSVLNRGFVGQKKLTGVTIPKSVVKIGDSAFSNCDELESVKINGVITDIGAYPFFASPFENSLKIEGDFVILNKDILYDYTGVSENIVIPDGIRVISGNFFTHLEEVNNFEIKSVSIPDSVEYICAGAFYNCDKIKSVDLGTGVKEIGKNVFTAQDITVNGYYETFAQTYAKENGMEFEPILAYGEQSETLEVDFDENFRQYYFTDEKELSRDGVLVYRRNYNGEKIEVKDWNYSAKLSEIVK